MRRAILLAVVLCLGKAAAAQTVDGWTNDFKAMMDKAKAEKRFVLAYFYAVGSDDCALMDRKTFGLSAVQAALENFVKIRLEAKRDRGYALLYKVQQFPTVIFFDSEGRELDRFSGFADPEVFLGRAAEAIDPKTNYVALKERLTADPGDVGALYYMGYKYTRRNDYDRANLYFDKVEKLDPKNEKKFRDNIALRRAEALMQKGDFANALKLVEDFPKKYKDSDELERAELLRARLLWLTEKKDESLWAYREFLTRHPDSPFRQQAEVALRALSTPVGALAASA
ncbi:MAG: thioredoxin fold domain-containing protein, partial [Candidatus Sumerlaeota bacterium]|nr:thioredoxin fold domain-containing protein [Candidatus Sumerlaeota bacterium]